MKMVSAAKFARAEKALKAVRCLGPASNAILVKNEISTTDTPEENTVSTHATAGARTPTARRATDGSERAFA